MPQRWLFAVAIDQYRDKRLGWVAYAESGLKALARIFANSGIPSSRQELVFGAEATAACLPVRLNRFLSRLSRGDQLVIIWAGRGIARDGVNLLLTWDTFIEAPEATSFPVSTLFRILDRSRAGQVGMIWEVGKGPEFPASDWQPHLDSQTLAQLCGGARKVTLLSTSDPAEESEAVAALQSRIGFYAVGQCLLGQSRQATQASPSLTLEQLHHELEQLLPGLLRRHHCGVQTLSPRYFGRSGQSPVIAEISPQILEQQARRRLESIPWRRLVFRTESQRRLKDLRDWRKQYQRPGHAGPSTRRFASRIARSDIAAALNDWMNTTRKRFGYRRCELTIVVGDDGTGSLRSPDFEYSILVNPDPHDPTRIVWLEELGGFQEPDFFRNPGFMEVFGSNFDQLQIEFASPLDLEFVVDRLEASPLPGLRLDFSGDSCDISLEGVSGSVSLDPSRLIIRRSEKGSWELLELFFNFIEKVGPLGSTLALTAANRDSTEGCRVSH